LWVSWIVHLRDPELESKHERLAVEHKKLEKEVKELRAFKKKVSVLGKLVKEIEKNTPSIKIARLVRRIGVVR